MAFSNIIFRKQGKIATIILNRPELMNAVNRQLRQRQYIKVSTRIEC